MYKCTYTVQHSINRCHGGTRFSWKSWSMKQLFARWRNLYSFIFETRNTYQRTDSFMWTCFFPLNNLVLTQLLVHVFVRLTGHNLYGVVKRIFREMFGCDDRAPSNNPSINFIFGAILSWTKNLINLFAECN